jgi:hypothetical protein
MERTLCRGGAQKQRRYFSATMPTLAKERLFAASRRENTGGRSRPYVGAKKNQGLR